MLNSSFIQGIELDDYHPAALHSNSLILPAILAAAPHAGQVSEARFLPGAILGYETGPRVGQRWEAWTCSPGAGIRARCSAPCLPPRPREPSTGWTPRRVRGAFGMDATQSCGLMSALFESTVKHMQHGFASGNGLTATALGGLTSRSQSRGSPDCPRRGTLKVRKLRPSYRASAMKSSAQVSLRHAGATRGWRRRVETRRRVRRGRLSRRAQHTRFTRW
jgi:MmgE/PrpD N-terminal domain